MRSLGLLNEVRRKKKQGTRNREQERFKKQDTILHSAGLQSGEERIYTFKILPFCLNCYMQKQVILIFSILLFTILSLSLNAQQPLVQKIKSADIIYVLNNIRSTYKAQTTHFIVNLFEVSNKSGSARQNESDEVTDHLYIAISEFDEKPQQLLFVIKDVYAPSEIKMIKQSEQAIQLSFFYIEKGEKKEFEALVTSEGVEKRRKE